LLALLPKGECIAKQGKDGGIKKPETSLLDFRF